MNHRRHANIVPIAALVRWVVVAIFLGTAGLGYVYFKNEMQATGNEIRNLEAQLDTLNTQDDIARAQIDRLSSHGYLERRLAEGFIKLTPIRDEAIVRIHLPASRTAGGQAADPADDAAASPAVDGPRDLQPVSNRILAQ